MKGLRGGWGDFESIIAQLYFLQSNVFQRKDSFYEHNLIRALVGAIGPFYTFVLLTALGCWGYSAFVFQAYGDVQNFIILPIYGFVCHYFLVCTEVH